MPSTMLKVVYNTDDRKKKNKLVDIIKRELSDLKDEIKKMSEDEIEIEKPIKQRVNIAQNIINFNKQKQEGQELKTLTPDEMLSRLPISLAQLKARSNSNKP